LIQTEAPGAVREALGSAWKGILGFGNRTSEVFDTAKQTVVTGASKAGETFSSTSTSKFSL
jgi:hypothetical protein